MMPICVFLYNMYIVYKYMKFNNLWTIIISE